MSEPLIIELCSSGLSAAISSLGAELVTLRDGSGTNLLWDGDPAVWAGRAPLLFPIVGSLNGGHFRLAGQCFELPRHGFARRSQFGLRDRSEAAVTFGLSSGAETRAIYPFDFDLQVTFTATGSELRVEAQVDNRNDEAMPASFGFHPAFRWPLPFGEPREHHRIIFADDEASTVRRLDVDGLLDPGAYALPLNGRTLHLSDELFEADALIFDWPNSRKLLYGASTGPSIEIAFPDMPHLALWSKPGAGFICIEPWQGYSDPAEFAGELAEKPGILCLPPGQQQRFAMTIRINEG